MHILFPTLGSSGDVYPLIPIAKTLRQRGHRVTIIANNVFRSLVETAELEFIALGDSADYQNLTENPDLWHPARGFNIVAKYGFLPNLRPLYEIIRQFSPHDTVIVSAALLMGAHLAHEKYGYPFVVLQLQPSLIRSVTAPPVLGNAALPGWMPQPWIRAYYRMLDRWVIDPALTPGLNQFRAELGLSAVSRVFERGIFSPQLNLCLVPEWFAPHQPDWPQHTHCTGFVAYQPVDDALPEEVETFLQSGTVPLVFTAGTAMLHGRVFFESAVQASILLKQRAILLTRQVEQVPPDLPDGILHQVYLPLNRLLPRAGAFIFHGGIGSMAQAFAAGVPQLVMPMSQDQPDNAARIQRLGVGDVLQPAQFSPDRVSIKIDHIIRNERIRQNCHDYKAMVDFEAALKNTCDAIESLAKQLIE